MRKLTQVIVGSLALAVLAPPQGVITAVQAHPFPQIIPLLNGFQPEGIAVGSAQTMYIGSIPTGAIYQANLRTGQGTILVPSQEGRMAIGMGFNPRTNY